MQTYSFEIIKFRKKAGFFIPTNYNLTSLDVYKSHQLMKQFHEFIWHSLTSQYQLFPQKKLNRMYVEYKRHRYTKMYNKTSLTSAESSECNLLF